MSDPKLKEAMAEINGVLMKHDIAGYIILVSPTHVEYAIRPDPSWSAMFWEGPKEEGRLRFRVKQAEIGDKEKARERTALTCHIVYQIRDMCFQGLKFAETMIKMVEKQIKVEHKSFQGFEPHREG